MDKLQVFISWSGARAHEVAKQLKAWLPDVVRNAEPWLSSEDLRKGLQWLPELNKNLAATRFGLLVLTADNKNAPWLLFEAGVISKALPERHCCPVLCGLKQTDLISSPLAQFQSTVVTSVDDMLKLAKTMNTASADGAVDDERLTKWFNRAWDEFAKSVGAIVAAKATAQSAAAEPGPSDRQLLEEILQTTRRIALEPTARRSSTTFSAERAHIDRLLLPPEYLVDLFAQMPLGAQGQLLKMMVADYGRRSPAEEKALWEARLASKRSLDSGTSETPRDDAGKPTS